LDPMDNFTIEPNNNSPAIVSTRARWVTDVRTRITTNTGWRQSKTLPNSQQRTAAQSTVSPRRRHHCARDAAAGRRRSSAEAERECRPRETRPHSFLRRTARIRSSHSPRSAAFARRSGVAAASATAAGVNVPPRCRWGRSRCAVPAAAAPARSALHILKHNPKRSNKHAGNNTT
jgi:hypothetical protein